jgi:hypothetical protein
MRVVPKADPKVALSDDPKAGVWVVRWAVVLGGPKVVMWAAWKVEMRVVSMVAMRVAL